MPNNSNFEYVFYFLFRTSLLRQDHDAKEPSNLGFDTAKRTVTQEGTQFETDKRLFRRDVTDHVPLKQWREKLKLKWQDLVQLYGDKFGDREQGEAFCQQALIGVALVILDDSVQDHSVEINYEGNTPQSLEFIQPSAVDHLFSISAQNKQHRAYLYDFIPVKLNDGKPFLEHCQLRLGGVNDDIHPYLAPLLAGEVPPNPVFSVYRFTYGSAEPEWKTAVEKVLLSTGPAQRHPLFSSIFTRLIVRQWQFGRIDEAAKKLRAHLRDRNNFYYDYAYQDDGMRPECVRTQTLEAHVQEMQTLTNDALFLKSRLQDAVQTLDINGENLTKRLEEIRLYEAQYNWQLCFHSPNRAEALRWPPTYDEVPLLKKFELDIKKLRDHKVYLDSKILYLEGLQQRWRFYLRTRQTRLNEHLNVLATLVILLLAGNGGVVTFNLYKSNIVVSSEYFIYLIIIFAVILLPLLLYAIKWLAKLICCITYSTRFYHTICQILKAKSAIEFYHWFNRHRDQ